MVNQKETTLEEGFRANARVLFEMPTGKTQNLPPPPTKQARVMWSSFRKVFEHSQRVESNGLLDIGCFAEDAKAFEP